MVDRFALLADESIDLRVRLDGCARQNFPARIGFQRVLAANLAHHLHRFAHHAAVFLRSQIIRVNRRMGEGIVRGQHHRAPAFRAQLAGVNRIAILLGPGIAMVHHDGVDEVQLNIRHRKARPRGKERARLQEVVRPRTGLIVKVLQAHAQLLDALLQRIGRQRHRHVMDHRHVQMVLKVAANAGGLHLRLDAMTLQHLRIPHARKLQDLRRLHGPCREDHFAVGADLAGHPALAFGHFHAHGLALLDQHARHHAGGNDLQVGPLFLDRAQIGKGRAPAAALEDRTLIAAKAFLVGAVEIFRYRIASFLARIDEGLVDRPGKRAFGHVQRAAAAMEVIRPALIAFRLAEIGQHIGKAPALQAHLAPEVIVARMPPDVDHPIDRGGAAPALAARPVEAPVFHMLLRLGEKAPVIVVRLLDQPAHTGGHLNHK